MLLIPILVHRHGVVIKAGPLSLQRAITNLIDDALKYESKADMSVYAEKKEAKYHG